MKTTLRERVHLGCGESLAPLHGGRKARPVAKLMGAKSGTTMPKETMRGGGRR